MKPLKPVMAALLAASSAVFVLPGISLAAPCSTAVGSDALAALSCIVATNPQAQTDIGRRISRFLMTKDDKGGYLYLRGSDADDAQMLADDRDRAADWPAVMVKTGGSSGVAVLFFVLGPDEALPNWAKDLANNLKPGMKWNGLLQKRLDDEQWTGSKKIVPSEIEQVTAFLNESAKQASKVFDDGRGTGEIDLSILKNEVTSSDVPPTQVGESGAALNSTGSGFSFDDLYKTGAITGPVSAEDDEGYRTISLKVYTMKDSSDRMITQICAVDITQGKSNTPSQPKCVDQSFVGDSNFSLHRSGRPYTLSIGSDGSVTLKRAKDPKETITTTLTLLAKARNDQITGRGIAFLGKPPLPYYVLGQGGANGSALFFSQAKMRNLPSCAAAPNECNPHPDLMADVSQVNSDNSTGNVDGKPDLGTLPDGTHWCLKFNSRTGMWDPTEGKGDPKPKPGDPTPPDQSTSTARGGSSGSSGSGGSTGPAAPKTLEEAVAIAEKDKDDKTQVWVEADGNAGFDDDTHALVRIMSNVQRGETRFNILFDPGLGIPSGAWPVGLSGDVHPLRVRGLGGYVVLEFPTEVMYFSLENLVNFIKSSGQTNDGTYTTKDHQMHGVTSVDIMADVLTQFMKVKKGDPMLATIRERVAQHAKDAAYTLNGSVKNTIVLVVAPSVSQQVWPDDKPAGDTGTNEGMTGFTGPGTVVALTGGPTEQYRPEIETPGGHALTLVKAANHAAVYTGLEDRDDSETPAKVWYLFAEYKKNGMESRTNRMPMPIFQDMKDLPPYQMQGLNSIEIDTASCNKKCSPQFGSLYGSNKKDGAIVLYRYALPDASGGQNVKGKVENCVGPVFAWGKVTLAQAKAACESDSKLP